MINVNLFSQLPTLIPQDKFDSLVKKHHTNKHHKGINSWTHLVSLLFCHIGGAGSVRDIHHGLLSSTGNIHHLGVSRVPCKSSLSYINAHRSHVLFKDLYYALVKELSSTASFARKGPHQLKRKVY